MVVDLQELARRMLADYDARTPGQLFGEPLDLTTVQAVVPQKYRSPTMGYDGALVLEFLARTHQTSLLTDREKHLIGLAVTMTRGCQVCTRGRIEKARAAGIGDDVLNALIDVVAAVNAGVSAATAREGFRLADASLPEECGALCSPEVSAGR